MPNKLKKPHPNLLFTGIIELPQWTHTTPPWTLLAVADGCCDVCSDGWTISFGDIPQFIGHPQ
jgi:hypothetical protein